MKPLVSVCVQTYNHDKYIKACLDSILMQQTTFAFEILLGEDESADGTRQICKEYADRYPEKIRLFLRSRKDVININDIPTGRFNVSENLIEASGKYIALCEGDDYWTDSLKLQKQVDFLEANSNYAICFHRANTLLDTGKSELHHIPDISEDGTYEYSQLLDFYNFITTASVVFRKPEPFNLPKWFYSVPFGDLAIYKLAADQGKIKCLEEVMSVYRIHAQGAYSNLNALKKVEQYLDFYNKIYPYLSKKEKQIVRRKQKEFINKLINLKHSKSKYPKVLLRLYYTLNL